MLEHTGSGSETSKVRFNSLGDEEYMATMPSLIHIVRWINSEEPYESSEPALYIRNIGNGPAINISIEKIRFDFDDDDQLEGIIENIPILKPHEEVQKKFHGILNGKPHPAIDDCVRYIHHNPSRRVDPFVGEDDIVPDRLNVPIAFKFSDIEGNEYEQTNYVIESGYRHGKVKLINN